MSQSRSFQRYSAARLGGTGQRGIALVITLIALVMLLVASVALVRSFTTSNLIAGSLSFKRDLVNQGDRGIYTAQQSFLTGVLANAANRVAAQAAVNYSPCVLNSDLNGVPIILEDDTNFATTGDLNGSIDPNCAAAVVASVANDYTDPVTGVQIRYIVDRQCATTALPATGSCLLTSLGNAPGGTVAKGYSAGNCAQVSNCGVPLGIYRVSVRVTSGNTRTYVQSIISM